MMAFRYRHNREAALWPGPLSWTQLLLVAWLLLTGCASVSSLEDRLAGLQQEGREALESGDNTSAMVALREAYSLAPENLDTLELLLRLHNRLGERDSEVVIALQLVALQPDHARALTQLGQIALQQGNLTVADQHFARATRADPAQWAAWNGMGIIADQEGRHGEAQAHFGRSLEILPGNPRALANLGWSLLLVGRLSEAEQRLRESLEVEPEARVTRSNLAHALALQGDYQQAEQHYRMIYDAPTTANNLGYAAWQRGDLTVARGYLRDALRLSPTYYERAARTLERLEAGETVAFPLMLP
jgi:Flp pilus assembly protein TadD